MRILNKKLLILGGLATIVTVGVLFWQKDIVLPYAKRVATKNIILVQKFRKLSDILFLPQKIFGADNLDVYSLEIKPADWQTLNDNLPKGDYYELEAQGLLAGAISGANKFFVNADFIYNGQSYKVDVRYRGESYDHWFYPKKSWLVRFDDTSPLGMKKINLIIPEDRSYLGEQLSNWRAKKLGLVVPESGLVKLTVNGVPQGVYWWVEDWSEELLQKNKQPAGSCLYGAEKILVDGEWLDRALSDPAAWQEYTGVCGPDFKPLTEFLRLMSLSRPEFLKRVEAVVDIEKIMTWDALAKLQGSKHGQPYNVRLLFNGATGKFEFIPWDFGLRGIIAPTESVDAFYNEFIARLLVEPKYYNLRNQILWDYVSVEKNLQDDLAFYDDLFNKTKLAFLRDANKNESNLEFLSKVKKGRQDIIANVERIKKFLSTTTESFVYIEEQGGRRQIRVASTGAIPVYLAEIECPVKCPLLDIYYGEAKLNVKEKKKDLTIIDKVPINAERSELSPQSDSEIIISRPFTFIIAANKNSFEISNVLLRNYVTDDPVVESVKVIPYDTP